MLLFQRLIVLESYYHGPIRMLIPGISIFFLSLTSESLLFGLFQVWEGEGFAVFLGFFCFVFWLFFFLISVLYYSVYCCILIMPFLLSHRDQVYMGSEKNVHKCPPLWPSSFPAAQLTVIPAVVQLSYPLLQLRKSLIVYWLIKKCTQPY